MNDALREAASVAPDWARSEHRKLWLLKAVTLGAVLAIAIGTFAVVVNVHQGDQITKIEHSACAKNAASKECQDIRAEAAKAANLFVTCIPFHKAGYVCPLRGPGGTDTTQNALSVPNQFSEGDATQKPEKGHQHSGPAGGPKPAPPPHKGSGKEGPLPEEEASAPEEQSPAEEPKPSHPLGEVLEDVTGLLNEVACSVPALCP
jgi:hypothetical protein